MISRRGDAGARHALDGFRPTPRRRARRITTSSSGKVSIMRGTFASWPVRDFGECARARRTGDRGRHGFEPRAESRGRFRALPSRSLHELDGRLPGAGQVRDRGEACRLLDRQRVHRGKRRSLAAVEPRQRDRADRQRARDATSKAGYRKRRPSRSLPSASRRRGSRTRGICRSSRARAGGTIQTVRARLGIEAQRSVVVRDVAEPVAEPEQRRRRFARAAAAGDDDRALVGADHRRVHELHAGVGKTPVQNAPERRGVHPKRQALGVANPKDRLVGLDVHRVDRELAIVERGEVTPTVEAPDLAAVGEVPSIARRRLHLDAGARRVPETHVEVIDGTGRGAQMREGGHDVIDERGPGEAKSHRQVRNREGMRALSAGAGRTIVELGVALEERTLGVLGHGSQPKHSSDSLRHRMRMSFDDVARTQPSEIGRQHVEHQDARDRSLGRQ